ncbi:MAG: carboxypeptidase-like regulatory domain-containing protein [Dysgonomonas sp.]|uniref:energy transducer TonB n=1 Tax=Dysgonomonas sp. TaxID=1891233 RepID=UPI0039E43FFC
MKFLNYIHGNRKGKDAHRIEKDAMEDPFLADAIEGYDSIPGNHAERIARMRSAITARSARKKPHGAWKVAVAAVGLIVVASGYFILMNHQSSMLTAHESGGGYIDLYVPEDYVEQKRLELTAIQEENPKKEVTATSVANISNLHEIIAPVEPLRVYLPDSYAQLHQREERELSAKRETISRSEREEIVSADAPILAKQYEASVNSDNSVLADSNQNKDPDESIGNTEIYLSQTANGVMTTRSVASKRMAAPLPVPKKTIALSGKIVDSNNEPIIGATVVQKGTNKGTVTDIDGNYKLNTDSEDAPLTAYLIGFEKLEIPDPKDAKIVVMKEETGMLDEVVVTGYGTQKKSMVTGSVSEVKSLSKNKVAEIKPEPIGGMKEYKKYIEQNLVHPSDPSCQKIKGKVVLQFSVNTSGHPQNITVKKSLCPSLDQEAIRLLKDGPKWKAGNTTAEIEVKF